MKLRKPDFRGLFQELRQFSARRAARRALNAVQEGWYLAGDRPSEDRVRLLTYNYTANVVANLIGGSFFTGLLLLMNADDSFIGSMTMIATAANMLQLFAPLLLERFARRKRLLLTLRLVMQVFNVLLIGLIPIFPAARQARLAMVAVSVLIVNVLNAFMAPGLTVWHIQSIPGEVRKPFFSLITMTVGAIVALANLLGSFVVDAFKAGGLEYWGLLTLRLVAFGLVLFEFFQLSRVSEYPYEKAAEKLHVRTLLLEPFKNKLYLRTVLVVFLWNVTANIPGSYYTVYLLKNVGVSYTYITTVNLINVPVVLLLTLVEPHPAPAGLVQDAGRGHERLSGALCGPGFRRQGDPGALSGDADPGLLPGHRHQPELYRHPLCEHPQAEPDGLHRLLLHGGEPGGPAGRDLRPFLYPVQRRAAHQRVRL